MTCNVVAEPASVHVNRADEFLDSAGSLADGGRNYAMVLR